MIGRRILLTVMLGVFAADVGAQNVTSVQVTGNTVRCMLSNGSAVDFSPATDHMVRVEYRQNNASSKVSEIMDSSFSSALNFSGVDQAGDPIVLTGPNYSVSISKAPMRIVFRNAQGAVLWTSTSVGQFAVNGTLIAGSYYGLRNEAWLLNSGNLVTGGSGNEKIFDPSRIQQGGAISPFEWTPKGFGILIDAEDGYFNFTNSTTLNITRANPGCANTNCLFWLMSGTPTQIMASYYKATGAFPVPPRWTCGFMNSEWGMNETELKSHITTYRSKNIPLDAFIFDYDWFYYNQTNNGDFKWNTGNYPSVSTNFQAWPVGGALKQWTDAQGVKMVGIRKPHGIWAGSTGWGNCGDFYSPATQTLFWERFVDPAYDSRARGIIAYWDDEAEACTNGYKALTPTYMQKSLYMGQRYNTRAGWPQYHNDRVWSISRSYYCGAQRYAYGLWSGDIANTNQSLQDNRKFMLTSINLGAAWWGQDIGGFWNDPTAADYQHWVQFGVFTPIMRVHGNEGKQRQPWIYTNGYAGQPADGGVAERVATNAIRLRYTLIPYIYSAYWKLHREGIPLVRPLVMDYPADNNVTTNVDSWMFGDFILASPVVTNYTATTKSVYVPAGTWYNFWTDALYTGGANVSIPVTGMGDTIPVLVKQGAVIPRQPTTPYINNYPITQNGNYATVPVTFHVYGGAGSTYTYTDDDGVTYDYETGEYRAITYTHTSGPDFEQVAIGAKQGTYAPVDSNGYFVFHGIAWEPKAVIVPTPGNIVASKVETSALSGAAAPAWAYDAARKTVSVKVASPFTEGIVSIGAATSTIRSSGSRSSVEAARITIANGCVLIPVNYTGNKPLTVRLVTSTGAVVREYRLPFLSEGKRTLSLSTGNLPRGVCLAVLTTGDCMVAKRIAVAR